MKEKACMYCKYFKGYIDLGYDKKPIINSCLYKSQKDVSFNPLIGEYEVVSNDYSSIEKMRAGECGIDGKFFKRNCNYISYILKIFL